MQVLDEPVIQFFQNQGFVIVSSIDKDGGVHNSCKGIVALEKSGKVYLLDVYTGMTFNNLKRDPHISITAIDEHKFKGYCLKGKAVLATREQLDHRIVAAWDEKITSRISRRIIKNMQGEKGHSKHPEVLLPVPQYMIVIEVEHIIDLTPHHLKE